MTLFGFWEFSLFFFISKLDYPSNIRRNLTNYKLKAKLRQNFILEIFLVHTSKGVPENMKHGDFVTPSF